MVIFLLFLCNTKFMNKFKFGVFKKKKKKKNIDVQKFPVCVNKRKMFCDD